MNARLNRLFAADGRCFDVAVDHGFFGEASFLAGIEDMERAIETLVEAGPDAIQLSPGQAPLLQQRRGPKPAFVLRTDLANVYGREGVGREYLFSELLTNAVEKAARSTPLCVVVNVLLLPGQPELYHACLRNVSARVSVSSERYSAVVPGRTAPSPSSVRRSRSTTADGSPTFTSLARYGFSRLTGRGD